MNRADWPVAGSEILPKKTIKRYMKRDNWHGLLYLTGHFCAIACTGTLLYFVQGSLWLVPAIILHGGLIAFLFAPMHEACHNSAFRDRWLNKLMGHLIGLIILRPFLYLRYRHMAHHTFTQHPDWDPDRVAFPASYKEYFLHVSSYNIWHRMVANLIGHARGRITDQEREFLPSNEISAVVLEARVMLTLYAAIAVLSVAAGSWAALYFWLLPRILGEPLLRAVRMVEHTGMEESPNMLGNTRSTATNALVRAVYWNMPYHVEHHLYPSVPFHALPRLHREVRPHAKEIGRGIVGVHYTILRRIGELRRRAEPLTAG